MAIRTLSPALNFQSSVARSFVQYAFERVATSRPIFVVVGIDYARFVNTSVQFTRYRCTSTGSTSLPDRSDINRQYPSSTFDDAQTVFESVCEGIGVLSGEIIHYLFASFACIPSQSLYTTKTAGCAGVVVHRLHQNSTHMPRRLVFARVRMGRGDADGRLCLDRPRSACGGGGGDGGGGDGGSSVSCGIVDRTLV